MKKALAIAGILALSITPTASFASHLAPKDSEIRPAGDLYHTNLKGRNLSGANRSNADLTNANLSHANLRGANLSNADLRGAFMRGANLTNADLKNAWLNGAILSGVTATNLRGCPSSLPRGWVCENNSLIQR